MTEQLSREERNDRADEFLEIVHQAVEFVAGCALIQDRQPPSLLRYPTAYQPHCDAPFPVERAR